MMITVSSLFVYCTVNFCSVVPYLLTTAVYSSELTFIIFGMFLISVIFVVNSTHMQDLKDVTTDVHYENYRAEHISEQLSSNPSIRG